MANIKKILKNMTLTEKIGQLTQYNAVMYVDSDATITGDMKSLNLTEEDLKYAGSILNFSSPLEMREIQKMHLQEDRNKIPMLFMMDVVHGFRTIYPIPLALGCSFNVDLVEECSKIAAKEAVAGGVQVTFAPMVDYVRDARWGRVMESCGEDALLNGIMGAAQVRAFQGDELKNTYTIAACVKHFAAYGGAEAGRDYNTVELSEHALREHYLPAYRACIDAGVEMLMPSFNTLNGIPATANHWLMSKILKEEWNFEGIVISDYGAIRELIDHGIAENEKQCAELAFKNNCDIEMCSSTYIHNLKQLVAEGVISEEDIDKSVLKVLDLKNRLGMFENPFRGASDKEESDIFLTPKNRETVRIAAEECAVLLKNNGILPLSENIKKVAVIGPFADSHDIIGFWACNGRNEESITVYDGIKRILPDADITITQGCSIEWDSFDTSGFEEAISAAKIADAVIVCLGEPQDYSGEGNSRVDISIHRIQLELVKAVREVNKNIVAVTFSGRPIILTKLEPKVSAILHMWFPGTEGGNAVANLLFGKSNPSGKLSISFPEHTGQCPIYYNHTNIIKNGKKGAHNPYCASYIECNNAPLYAFGYGLSYSNFVYESLILSKTEITKDEEIEVGITIYNRSDIKGKETVMLYIQDVVASNARPIQQLIDFKKVSFGPYERKILKFIVNERVLRFWNNDNKLVSETGEFKISTGYADHLILTQSFYLK